MMVHVAAGMRIVAMTLEYAADIATWRYPAPYDCYDVAGVEPAFFLDPANGFFALVSGERAPRLPGDRGELQHAGTARGYLARFPSREQLRRDDRRAEFRDPCQVRAVSRK